MRYVSATEANRQFSKLLGEVKAGNGVVITSRGKPVAKMVPADAETEARRRAHAQLIERVHRQPISGEERDWTRDELYDR